MTSRRGFLKTISIAGVSLAAACSEKVPPPAQPTAAATAGSIAAPPAAPLTPSTPPATASDAASPISAASTFPMLNPAEPAAVALGYVEDATKANAAKYPNYAAGQACVNCALYAGRASDATAPCPLFPGRQVSARGWCSGYNKKTT